MKQPSILGFLLNTLFCLIVTGSQVGCNDSSLDNSALSVEEHAAVRPNIIVILTDDMRWDAIGVMGNEIISTPSLDKLANEGVRFTNNFVTTSICSASRASLYTGQYARRHGVWDFDTPLAKHQLVDTYAAQLRSAGYHTAFFGKWGIGGAVPTDIYDVWGGFIGQGSYYDEEARGGIHLTRHLGDEAVAYLSSSSSNQPFCLTIATKAPHAQNFGPDSFIPDPEFSKLYENDVLPKPASATKASFQSLPKYIKKSMNRTTWKWRFSTEQDYQDTVKQYYRLITGVDVLVGRLVSTLKAKGLYDNTVIIFTSDN